MTKQRDRQSTSVKSVSTPWGMAQSKTHYGEGVEFFSTAGHGGFRLNAERMKQLPERVKRAGTFTGQANWFEEDCDWALVCIAFPALFSEHEFFQAVGTLQSYHPSALNDNDKAQAARWLSVNGNLWVCGSQGTTANFGWFVNAYRLSNPEERTSREFGGIPLLPATFTKAEFDQTNWELYKG